MDIVVFEQRQVPVALGALRSLDPQPSPVQDRFLEIIGRLHGLELQAGALPLATADDAARVVLEPHRRKRLLQLAIVASTLDGAVSEGAVAAVKRLAGALGVDEPGLKTLREVAAHHELMTRADLTRRILGRFLGEAWHEERFAGVRKMLSMVLPGGTDAALAARFEALGRLPLGTFGREYHDHCLVRGFAFPGQPHGIPERMVFHDLGHVLAGYDTDPEGEIQQAAFQAGFVRNDGFSFLLFAIVQFHLGIKVTPVAEAQVGLLDVTRILRALERGAACKVDLSDHWDYWPWLSRPLQQVRADLGIPPLSAS